MPDQIKQLVKGGTNIYPVTIPDAVFVEGNNTLKDTLLEIAQTYEKKQDLLEHFSFNLNESTNILELKIDNTVVAAINKSLLTNVVKTTSFDPITSNLSIIFSNDDSITINVGEVINQLVSQHIVLTKEAYDNLQEIDPTKFYYTYEDE